MADTQVRQHSCDRHIWLFIETEFNCKTYCHILVSPLLLSFYLNNMDPYSKLCLLIWFSRGIICRKNNHGKITCDFYENIHQVFITRFLYWEGSWIVCWTTFNCCEASLKASWGRGRRKKMGRFFRHYGNNSKRQRELGFPLLLKSVRVRNLTGTWAFESWSLS